MEFSADFGGCRRPCKYCLLFLTKDVLYLLSHSSILSFLPILEGFGVPRFMCRYSEPKDVLAPLSPQPSRTAANATSIGEF